MREWISASALSALVASIYDSAIDPARWPVAMEAMRTTLDCRLSSLNLQTLPDLDVILNVYTNIPDHYGEMIAAAGVEGVETWGGPEVVLALPMDRPAVLSRANPTFDPQTTTNRYYLEFARPLGLVDLLSIIVARDDRAVGTMSFARHESAGPVGEREIEIARLLTPHVQRAATINRLLDMCALRSATFAAVLDRFAAPVILTGANMQIVHANPAAAAMLARGDVLRSRHGRFGAANPGVDRAVAADIAAASADEAAMGHKGLAIPAAGADGAACVLHVLPLSEARGRHLPGASVAIFVGQAQSLFVAPGDLLAALFGLTAAEARVFEQIAEGHGVNATAANLGVAPSTVKTHVTRLYQKTGARRHVHLVQIAASLAPPVA
jgi:DNA-binding CsgD family transcriptional regulator/PAS domain-containing protein